MLTEAEYFTGPYLRTQTAKRDSMQDTYLAYETDDLGVKRSVFVKGPYTTRKQAGTQAYVHAFKMILCPLIPVIKSHIVELKVDKGFMKTDRGFRSKWREGETGFFTVYDDKMSNGIPLEKIPLFQVKTTVSSEHQSIVNARNIKLATNFRQMWHSKCWFTSIFYVHPALAFTYLKHIILSWVIGIGRSKFTLSNFFISGGQIYQVGLERFGGENVHLGDTTLINQMTQKFIYAYIGRYWESKFKPFLNTISDHWIEYAPRILSTSPDETHAWKTIGDRITSIKSVSGLCDIFYGKVHIFPHEPKRLKIEEDRAYAFYDDEESD